MAETPVVSDLFNRTNENPIASPWAKMMDQPCKLESSAIANSAPGNNGSLYDSGTLASNQYVKANYVSGSYGGLIIRGVISGSTKTGYLVWWSLSGVTCQGYRMSGTGPTYSSMGNFNTSQSNVAKVVTLKMVDTSLEVYTNTTLEKTYTDATYSSGRCGCAPYSASMDNFVAGDITADATFKAAWATQRSRVIGGNT